MSGQAVVYMPSPPVFVTSRAQSISQRGRNMMSRIFLPCQIMNAIRHAHLDKKWYAFGTQAGQEIYMSPQVWQREGVFARRMLWLVSERNACTRCIHIHACIHVCMRRMLWLGWNVPPPLSPNFIMQHTVPLHPRRKLPTVTYIYVPTYMYVYICICIITSGAARRKLSTHTYVCIHTCI